MRFIPLLFLLAFPALADDTGLLSLESPARRTQLVELYSSEGCASCPPAEAWMGSLRKDKKLWKEFVPVEFHVDYWNHLGWIDPYSKTMYAARQQQYVKEWQSKVLATPTFVRNGKEWKNAQKKLMRNPLNKIGVLSAKQTSPNMFDVTFKPHANGGEYAVYGALLGNGISDDVLVGENAGKKLKHEFVVLKLETKPLMNGKASLDLGPTTESKASSHSAAFWVTKAGSLEPLQAVGGDLKVAPKVSKPDLSKLTPEQIAVTQNGETEAPFHNAYWNNHEPGIYVDVVSGEALFSSTDKFDSGTGWPSFTKPLKKEQLAENTDSSLMMERTEIRSKNANSHLGHVFNDGPGPTKLRYCVNSAALRFVPVAKLKSEGLEEYLPLFDKKPAPGN